MYYSYNKIKQATISSPLSGQKNRSSQNFKIDSLPVGTKELKWVIVPSEKDHPSTISFNVMIDVPLGTDSIRWKKYFT